METQSVSIVIPTYKEVSYVGHLLDALVNQTYANFDVIVSDAVSRDGTAALVDSYRAKLRVTFVESPPAGPGVGRNEGSKLSQSTWLLFLDADNDIVDPNFIQKLVNVAIANNWQTATAKVLVRDGNPLEKLGNWINYRYIKFLAGTKHPVAPGWCILTKRELFNLNHGFNPKIQFGEDYDYVSRVARDGFGFVEETSYLIDLRRAREEGWRFVVKCVSNEIYRHRHHYNLENNPHKYEFGKHKERK